MERNLVLAIALSILVYIGWYTLIEKHYGPRNKPIPQSQAPQPQAPIYPATAPKIVPATPSDAAITTTKTLGERIKPIPLRVGRLDLKLQPMGASLTSFQYPGPTGIVELIPMNNPGFFATWPKLRFKRVGIGKSIVLEATHPTQARIRKEFVLREFDGLHTLLINIQNPTSTTIEIDDLELWLGPGLGTVKSEQKENSSLWANAVFYPPEEGKKRGKFEVIKTKEETAWHDKPWKWLGLHNRYFLAALIAPTEHFMRFQTGALQSEKIRAPWMRIQGRPKTLAPSASVTIEIPFYFGPKGYTHLKKFGLDLERSVSFGWFHRLGRFTLKILNFLHDITGNWGWAIILLTILLQFVLFPLTYKSFKSMAVMKKIQPEISKVQQKFKSDPRRMNTEMMGLYKKHGANPLGGCLPMLVQMPIFIALFNMLRNAWELHGAPWIFWVRDLSAKDPYYVLPLIMGGIMFAQNKLNPPATADPAQAKLFTYMPVIFTFMFLNFPSGLVLYWLTNSILNFAQQLSLKKRMS